MSLFQTDVGKGKSVINRLRGALADEISATNLYEELLNDLPEEFRPDLEEIRSDELNHQGRLLDLIMKLDKTQLEPFNKGLEHED